MRGGGECGHGRTAHGFAADVAREIAGMSASKADMPKPDIHAFKEAAHGTTVARANHLCHVNQLRRLTGCG